MSGISKWTVDGEACFNYWAKINSDCSVCIRVCPYTRDFSNRTNRWWLRLADSRLRRLALWIDRRQGRGERMSSNDWWPADEVPVQLGPRRAGEAPSVDG